MSSDKRSVDVDIGAEGIGDSHRALIVGASSVLDTLTVVWRFSLAALIGSLSVMGVVAIVTYFAVFPRESLFLEGFVFLAMAAWIFFRSLTGRCCTCCTVEIPRWRSILASFIKPDSTVDAFREGEGVVDSVMQVMLASEEWMRVIRRELFSMLLWPILAAVVLLLTVYTVDATTVKMISLAFIGYIFALTVAIYYTVNQKFQPWQRRVAKFKANLENALQAM